MLKLHRSIKATTDKLPGELDIVEFLGGAVLSVGYAGGRDWIAIVRGASTWKLEGEDLDRADVVAWLEENGLPRHVTGLVQRDDGTVMVELAQQGETIDPVRRLPFPTGHPQLWRWAVYDQLDGTTIATGGAE